MNMDMKLLKEVLIRDRKNEIRIRNGYENTYDKLFGDGNRDMMCDDDYINEGEQNGRMWKIEYITDLIKMITDEEVV